jgi:hypothetical protein
MNFTFTFLLPVRHKVMPLLYGRIHRLRTNNLVFAVIYMFVCPFDLRFPFQSRFFVTLFA